MQFKEIFFRYLKNYIESLNTFFILLKHSLQVIISLGILVFTNFFFLNGFEYCYISSNFQNFSLHRPTSTQTFIVPSAKSPSLDYSYVFIRFLIFTNSADYY